MESLLCPVHRCNTYRGSQFLIWPITSCVHSPPTWLHRCQRSESCVWMATTYRLWRKMLWIRHSICTACRCTIIHCRAIARWKHLPNGWRNRIYQRKYVSWRRLWHYKSRYSTDHTFCFLGLARSRLCDATTLGRCPIVPNPIGLAELWWKRQQIRQCGCVATIGGAVETK